MSLFEDAKRIAEKATSWRRPDYPKKLLRNPKVARPRNDPIYGKDGTSAGGGSGDASVQTA